METEATETEAKRGPGRPKKDPWEGRKRRNRAELGNRLKLQAEARPGFVRRWVNDENGRIEQMKELDYEPVLKDGEPVVRRVGRAEDGKGLFAHLMETPEDWYKEAQAEKQTLVVDPKTMKEAKAGEGEYIPGNKESAVQLR